MEYHLPNDIDPDTFKDDTDALWIMAAALLASCLRGKLQSLQAARELSSACAEICRQIEKAEA